MLADRVAVRHPDATDRRLAPYSSPMRIAIVGTGVAGMVAAHKLHPEHEIVVYEAADRLGGHSNTVEVEDATAGTLAIDTGFIVFNDRNYPNFEALLAELGVASQRSHMGFSVSDGERFGDSGTPDSRETDMYVRLLVEVRSTLSPQQALLDEEPRSY